MSTLTEEAAKALRAPFEPSVVGKLPRVTQKDGQKSKCRECGGYLPPHIHLDYVGHAAVTDRLLTVDPEWSWEPVAFDVLGAPLIVSNGGTATMWIRLTVCGVTRLGVGIAAGVELEKQLISDAIRNAAMRFGVALDLWSKQDLHDATQEPEPRQPAEVPNVVTGAPLDIETMSARELNDALRLRGLALGGTVEEMRRRLSADPSTGETAGDVAEPGTVTPGTSEQTPARSEAASPATGETQPELL